VKGFSILAARFALFIVVVLVLAPLGGAVLAGAQPGPAPRPPEPPAEHLLLVPDTPQGAAALSRADARVVARYESFALVEAAGEDDRRLRAAGAQRRDDMREVATAAGPLDPEADRASLAGKVAPERDEVLALVQFIGPPKEAWVERLRATGARVVTYQAENAYVVHAGGDAVERLAELVGTDAAVRAVIALGAADKLEGRADALARYAVSTVAGQAGEVARAEALAAGPVVGAPATVGAVRTQYVELSPAEVSELARDPGVVAIERHLPPAPSDERSSQVVAGNLNAFAQPSGPGYLAWHSPRFGFTTFPFAIDVTDSGLDDGADPSQHPDFRELGSGASRLAYRQEFTSDTNTRDCVGHGTNVASIAAGYNDSGGGAAEDAAGYNFGLGVAPLAQIGVSKIFDCAGDADPFSPAALTSAAYADEARISNNSWGTGGFPVWGSYTTTSALYDQLVRDAQSGTGGNQQMVEVFSAGNDGEQGYASIHAEGTAKNVITVGASEGVRASGTDGCGTFDSEADSARDVVGFSSRGPTDDGRLKPDLVAPGTHVTGARPQHTEYDGSGTCNPFFAGLYSLVSGTSQAAPQVTGAAALVRDWYQDSEGAEASPALTKALLINTASDLAGGQNGKGDVIAGGPNADQGWGRVNLGATFDSTPRELYDQRPVDVLTGPGQTVVNTFEVQDPTQPVKVTLAWTDPPGPTTGNAYVNNLDLEVAAGGQTFRGNVFGGAYSRTGGTADPRNNVESAYLPPGASGPFSATVRATNVGGDGLPGNGDTSDQDFALVVSNAAEQAVPVLVHESTTIDDAVAGGDGDAVLESDEQVELTEEVRNAGNADATGVSATLTGGAGLAVTQGSSGYPAIPDDDGTGSNTAPFGARLANAATCGADVGATLAISSATGTHTVPLVLPTGEEAPTAQTHSAAAPQVPLAIPDDAAAGIASSVFVAERGRIKDLDVTIGSLTHTWVGDLVIEITGPDGTTVRLAEHPGGPDNDGDNLTGTSFDDEAPDNLSEGSAPYAGSFTPQNDQLSRFDGTSRRGTWTLRVRDLFQGDVGTLHGWAVASHKALCDVDTVAPDTAIAAGPASPTTATSAQFTLGSDDAGAAFECRLDGGAYEPCGATPAFGGLAPGAHSFSARAIDGSDNEDATPATYTWVVEAPPPPPPTGPPPPAAPAASFLLAPVEETLGDALARRLTVLAACSSACRASATLRVSARTARRLGLGGRAVTLGSGVERRGSAGTAKVVVALSRRARAALRGRRLTEATVKATITEGSKRLVLARSIELRRSAGLKRIASRGLRLWASCARACPLRAELTLSAAQARRLDLNPPRARYRVASGRITATRTPRLLRLAVSRRARTALGRARRVGALLEAVAGAAPEPLRTATLSKTLRR
jgi:subtilisin-like proprotein convertase family protein